MRRLDVFLRRVPIWLIAATVVAAAGACLAQPTTAPAVPPPGGQKMSFLELLLKGGWFLATA